MSEPRLKYAELAPEGLAKMRAMEHYLNTGTGLEPALVELVRLRASLLNGCEEQRERAALAWAEAVTNIQEGHAPDVLYEAVRAHFSEVETVNLTLAITTINMWNRLSIALGEHSDRDAEVKD
jgi:alkylhydroperoxidase family enzyme